MITNKSRAYIRRFQEKDIPYILEKVCEEVPKLPHYRNLVVDPKRVEFVLRGALADESTFMVHLLCNEDNIPVGGIAAYCVTSFLSFDKVCNDMFLYIIPEWRSMTNAVKLISSYKDWARRRGAKIIGATHTGGFRSDAMDMLLIKNGFERIGAMYYVTSV